MASTQVARTAAQLHEAALDVARLGTTPDGRIFKTARGGILQDSGYNVVWTEARKQALAPVQYRSPRADVPMTCGTRCRRG